MTVLQEITGGNCRGDLVRFIKESKGSVNGKTVKGTAQYTYT